MSSNVTIALDAMGGDYGPSVVVPAALHVLKEMPDLIIILVGIKDKIKQELRSVNSSISNRLKIKNASEIVEMNDLPSHALRMKKDSSMRVAINLVKNNEADACVSAGNTGALLATARFVLKTIASIERPAIIVSLPTIKGHTHVLDMGANVDTSANALFEFAVMGSILTSAVENIESPSVGLLNVGAEEMKGNERVKEVAALLSNSDLNYIGFVEGDAIYSGSADVIVCDGFVGNICLKTSEGLTQLIGHYMKQEFKRNILTKLAYIFAMPVLRTFKKKIDPRRYNGASLLGVQGIVIKSHGGADTLAYACAIREAVVEVEKNVPQMIKKQLETVLAKRRVV